MRKFSILVIAALVLSLACSAARAVGTVLIDDSTDNLTVSLDGTDLTALLLTFVPPNTSVGTLLVLGGLISTSPGCNNPGGTGECAVLRWKDPNVQTSLPAGGAYASPLVRLSEGPGLVSDLFSLQIFPVVGGGTEFDVLLNSDSEPGFSLGPCTNGTGCTDLSETGSFQNLTTALLTPVTNCSICTLPTGITNFSASVRSDVESTVPEPATLALLALGLAGLGFSRRKQ